MQNNSFNPVEALASIPVEKLNKHPNILIAAGFWEKDRYEAAKTCYKFMRQIDDMIDDRKADIRTFEDCEKNLFDSKVSDWIECLQTESTNDNSMEELVGVISKFDIPISLFSNFAKSMIYDIHNNGFPTVETFLQYSEGAAVAPASVFLHLCCLNENNAPNPHPSMELLKLARPCAIFSYIVHIIRDFQIDQLDNLNYFAEDVLREYKISADDLKNMANGGVIMPGFRKVVQVYLGYAEKYRQQTEAAIDKLRPFLSERYLLSLDIIYGLYLEIFNRIDVEKCSFNTSELTPTPEETRIIVSEIIRRNWRS